MSVTNAADIQLPYEDVELSLKTRSGDPVVVRCEFIDELRVMPIMKAWVGEATPVVDDFYSEEEKVQLVLNKAKPLIEAGTMLIGDNGQEVRPAFYFDDATPRHPQSINGRYLKVVDIMKLGIALFRLTGYAGGVANETSFPNGN